MRKLIAGGAIAASVVGGSFAVAAVNPLGLAGAQAPTEQEADPAPGQHPGPAHILSESLDELVAEGTIDQSQADAVRERVRAKAQERMGEDGPRFGRPGHRGAVLRESAEQVAGVLGVSTDDLRQALRDGTTLNDLAAQQGVDPAAVRQVLVDAANARIDQAVADGKIDAERGEQAKQRAAEGIDRFMAEGGPRHR